MFPLIELMVFQVSLILLRVLYQMLFNNFFVDIGPKLASKIQHTGKKKNTYFDYLIKPAQTCIYTKPILNYTGIEQVIQWAT